MNLFARRQCYFSEDRIYRYSLEIRWEGPGADLVNFLMLNPSTADETANDPTVERCERRARQLGFTGLIVTNIFAFRATDPRDMLAAVDPVGPENNVQIRLAAVRSDMVICAWGNHGAHRQRSQAVVKMLRGLNINLHALAVSKAGQPVHPLYQAYSKKPEVWLC